jgi:hypothetical protein
MRLRGYQPPQENTPRAHVYCWIAARKALKQAKQQESGRFYACMTAGVFSAFTIEAFLNHLGQRRVQEWNALERKLGPQEKLILLKQMLHFSADTSKRPFQTLRDILRLRNSLAHGKTDTVDTNLIVDDPSEEAVRYPKPDWMKLCSLSSVTRMVEDAEAMARDLNTQSGSKRDPFASPGHGSSGVSEVNEE